MSTAICIAFSSVDVMNMLLVMFNIPICYQYGHNKIKNLMRYSLLDDMMHNNGRVNVIDLPVPDFEI